MSTRIKAFGTLLKIGDGGGSEVFTTIAGVTSMSGPGITQEALDGTAHDSTDGYRERVGGLLDVGSLTLEIAYDPVEDTHDDGGTGLLATLTGGTVRNFQLVFSDAGTTTWSFAGIVTQFSPSAPVDGLLTASITIEGSGSPTLA